MTTKKELKVVALELRLIDEPNGVLRTEINPERVSELSASIQQIGQLQPILVRPVGDRYEIVYGHRRFLACQKIGMARISASVRELDDKTTMVMRATENLQREDLTPIEEARTFLRLTGDLGMSLEQAGQIIGKSTGVVKRRLDLLRMPENFQSALHGKKIAISVAEELWACPDAAHRDYLLEMAVAHGVTQAVARQWVDDYKKSLRTAQHGTVGGGGASSVFEPAPVYVSCDACQGPQELSGVKSLRICASCYALILQNLRA